MASQRSILGVFAKQPVAGHAKTRLAAATSAAWAQRVAQGFLEDTLQRVQTVDTSRAIVYAPATAAAYFETVANDRFGLIPQCEGDLGRRLQHFFTQSRRNGFARIVAIGTDSPTLPPAWIERAFQLLEENDVVIGPAADGGYYLLGCGDREFPLFEQIPWSTPRVLETTIERLRTVSARFTLLPSWFDVDTVDDWALLSRQILALRQAGLDPGVPCVERLIAETPS